VNFLLEIGTEEIPDWMIPGALEFLGARFSEMFAGVKTGATSRRLTVRAFDVAEKEADREEWVAGPAAGAPPQAVAGFAKKQGATPGQLVQREGKFAFLKKIPGRETKAVLAESIPGIVLKIPFPKAMYWTGKSGPRFIRPIRWIVALLGDEVVPFEIAGVRSGNESAGHRRLGKPQFPVTFDSYERSLRENGVILSADERRKKIEGEIPVRIKPDPKLLETLVYLTEYPAVVVGDFDPEFLALPEEILTTVMRSHQKYFSVETADGKLAPQFVAVMNTAADPDGLVKHGNERVLRARFNDARFFWETDQRLKLEERVESLKSVTFQAKLGSYYDKTQRVQGLVAILGGDEHALRAARLCKTDLTTELVKEFTELQGAVGGLYARVQGENEEVARAIYDHYKPASMEDSIPRTASGQFLSIADKLDTLIGCFRIGLIPTGSKDPFALRRAAQGVVKIIVEAGLRIPLRPFVDKDPKLVEFMLDRIRHYFRGFAYDEVNAVLAAGWDDLVDVQKRLAAIAAVRPTADFEPLAASCKRIANILKQANYTGSGQQIEPELLEAGPERDLYDAFEQVRRSIAPLEYQPALEAIATLRPAVDRFFDKVMVNVPDERVRHNRLALLHALLTEFSTIADFAEIVTNSQENKVQ
jgi:glycyl-tRNA synthetase beta chain